MTSNPKIEIVSTTWEHIHALEIDLRPGEIKEISIFDCTPAEALAHTFRESNYSRTALVDGRPAAIWGLKGEFFGDVATPFLLTGHESLRVSPIRFARIYLKELSEMKKAYSILENFVDSEYYEAVRLLKLAGFTVHKPFAYNDRMIRKFELIS